MSKKLFEIFGLQKTTIVDNYGGKGGRMDPNPLFPPTEAISGKISYTEWKLVKKEKITWWS